MHFGFYVCFSLFKSLIVLVLTQLIFVSLMRWLFAIWQIFNGVFLKVNKATVNMLHRVEPYVTYGYHSILVLMRCILLRLILILEFLYLLLIDESLQFSQLSQLKEYQGIDLQTRLWKGRQAENCLDRQCCRWAGWCKVYLKFIHSVPTNLSLTLFVWIFLWL